MLNCAYQHLNITTLAVSMTFFISENPVKLKNNLVGEGRGGSSLGLDNGETTHHKNKSGFVHCSVSFEFKTKDYSVGKMRTSKKFTIYNVCFTHTSKIDR